MASSDARADAVEAIDQRLDPELWVVTASDGKRRGGLIATFVTRVSIVPAMPRVLVGVGRRHRTWELIEAGGAFALHLVGEGHLDWVERFGLQSGRDADKLAGLDWRPGRSGSPVLVGAPAWLDCRVEARLETGDRTVYLAEVIDAFEAPEMPALTVRRMLQSVDAATRSRLDAARTKDAAGDAEAVRAWRLTGPAGKGRDED